MHLMFLGITQKLGMVVKQILTKFNKYSTFHSSEHVNCQIRDMNLDWCKLLPFGSINKPFSTWVSENCLAYVRTIKTIYSILENIINDEELVESIFFLINMWQATVSRIMKKEINDNSINDAERHVKMFLSALRDMESCYCLNDNKKKNMFETTANLNGLLNLHDFMREYGPLRLYWEGGYIGEGIIQSIKPCITQGVYKSSFATNALKKFYKEFFFKHLTNVDVSEDEPKNNKQILRYTKFRTYKKKEFVETLLKDGLPISVIILQNKVICFSCMDGMTRMVVKLIPDDRNGTLWFGTWVTNLYIGESINLTKIDLLDDNQVMGYGLAMPIYSDNTREIVHTFQNKDAIEQLHIYHIITNEWMERYVDNSIEMYIPPRVFGCFYG